MPLPDLLNFLRRLRPSLTDGQRGEKVAARFLRKQRYRILARNLRTRLGEVDILAQAPDGNTIVIVEVKARALSDFDSDASTNANPAPSPLPEAHVNAQKQRKLTSLASQIVRQFKFHDRPIRFDVIGVDLHPKGNHAVRHHVGAFESTI